MVPRKKAVEPQKRGQKIVVEVQDINVGILERGNQTVRRWFDAVKMAESTIYPDRRFLYNTYLDVSIDLHLKAMMGKRIRAVKTTPFEWSGLTNDALIDNFKSPWFSELLELIQSRIFYGTTLAEFKLSNLDGLIEDVELIPRQNVKPEKGIIMKDGYSEGDSNVIQYREGINANFILEIGRKKELGLLANIAPYVLMKRANFADFSRYNEMYGIDLRVYEYDPLKPGAREESEKSAKQYGSAAYIVVPKGMAQVTFPQNTNKQSSAFAFDKFHELCNNEITVGILGQLLTTGGADGGSYALGNVHRAVETAINLEDRLTAEYIINYPFKKNILIPHGYPIKDFVGKFKTAEEISKEKKLAIWIQLLQSGAPIAEEDFYKEFGIEPPGARPVVVRTNSTPPPPDPENPPAGDPEPEPAGGGDVKKPVKLSDKLKQLYARRCERDRAPQRVALSYKSELNEIIDRIIQQITTGQIKPGDVDPALYNLTSDQLFKAVEKGYGVKLEAAEGAEIGMLKGLRTNVYVFSGFKNYQFLQEATRLLTDDDGIVKPFNKFREDILKLNSEYNIDYLRAEYNYAVASAQMAHKWQKISDQKGTLPFLKYETVGDARVRAAHASIDGVVKPVDDPFWDTYMPPNAWNCRCTVRQLPVGEVTETSAENLPQLQEMFKMNSGKQAVIFPKSHPYFTVANGDEPAGDKNFGLPLPD